MSKYNQTVRDTWGLGRVPGEVGIEIEMEGRGFIRDGVLPYWSYHRDGSLRGEENAEYVLTAPLPRRDVPAALDNLFSSLKKHGCKIRKDSPNTSVHVHLNMQEWTVKKVYNLICLWYIFEKTLVDWCGEERAGNLFCLRGGDAEVALMRLASAIRYSKYNTIADQEGLRYSALNYTALAKFGSLEFRSLAGVYDESIINTWVNILLRLKDYAERFVCPSDIILEMSKLGHEDFLRAVFGDLSREISNPDVTSQMQQGMRLIQGVAYCVNWDRDTEIKKKDPVDNEVPGVEWLGIVYTVNDAFPDFRHGEDVDAYIDARARHGRLIRDHAPQAVAPAVHVDGPPRIGRPGFIWYTDQGGQFHEVHQIDVGWAARQGWTRWIPAAPPPVAPVEQPPQPPEDIRIFTDRNGTRREIPRGRLTEMRDRDGNLHMVRRFSIEHHIGNDWIFD